MSDSAPAQAVTFIHLHVHSAYSLSEGALPIARMVELAKTNQMPALAITDTNNLFGALEYSESMAKAGIQPLIGCAIQVDLVGEDPDPHKPRAPSLDRSHLVLIAKDETGYGHLMKLTSHLFAEGQETGHLHIDVEHLQKYAGGLICLTGGPDGPVNQAVVRGQMPLARQHLELLQKTFGDRLYVELQRHAMNDEQLAEPHLIDLAYEL